MKSIRWIGWVALVALFVVPLAATPALAAPNFSGTPLTGVVPLTVTFTPTGVTGTPDSLHWDFGDAVTARTPTAVPVQHSYSTGPADFTVAMHVWYGATDSSVTKGSYVSTVAPTIIIDSVDKAPCGGSANQNLPDTVHFTFFAPPADSIWWVIKDTTTGGTFIDSIKTTGTNKGKLTYVFTVPDTFLVTGKPFAADSLLSSDTAAIVYITSNCYCVQAVLDGYSMNENDTLRAFVTDNDTLGIKNQPRPIDSIKVMTHSPFHGAVLDTAYFDTTTTGVWRLIYIPQKNWHGKDSLTYEVWVHNGCVTTSNVATVAITVYSNFRVDIDSLWYIHLNTSNCGSCDASGNTINIGDSIQIWARINPVDVAELAPGWPKAFFAGMGGSVGGDVMFMDTTGYNGGVGGGKDSIFFSVPFQDTAGAYPDWRAVLGGGIDVGPGFYPLIAQALSDSNKLAADTVLVNQAIDTKPVILPPLSVTFTEQFDSLGNGIVGRGDWLRFFIDLRNNPIISNPPGSKEICQVYVTLDSLWGFDGPITVPLVDSANDNRFKGYYRVDLGRLEAPANSQVAWFFITDNGCNLDSVSATLAEPVDNKLPDSLGAITYQELLDRDSTNCLGVGPSDPLADSVLIRVTGVPSDIITLYADLLRAGIGGCSNLPLIAKYPLVNKGGGVWELRWLLKTCVSPDSVVHPYDHDTISPTFDGLAADDSVKLTGYDNSGNWVSKWSGPLQPLVKLVTLTLDTRVPKPVDSLACKLDTTAAGTPQFTLTWTWHDPDAQKFLIFWNDGCGEVKYTDTLAAVFFPKPTLIAGVPGYSWTSDSTVKPISPCRTYKFDVWTVDNCNNVERVHPTPTSCGITVPPVVNLDATTPGAGEVLLTWTGADSSAAKYYIYWDAGSGNIDYVHKLDSVIGGPGYQTWDSTNCSLFRPGFAGDSTYKFAVRTVDSCTVNTPSCPNFDLVGATDTVMIRHIKPVANLTCQAIEGGAIQLRWTSPENTAWLGTMLIHYGKDSASAIDWTRNVDTITYHQAGVWVPDSGFYRWNTTMANPVPALLEHGGYVWTIESVDKCGYSEVQHATPTFCYSDKAPAYACVIQPEPGSLYCDNEHHGLTIYTCAKDSASNDIQSVTAWGRLQDISPAPGLQPGDWFQLGGSSLSEPGVCFHINLDPFMLNYQVGADTVQRVEVAIVTTDVVGKTITPDSAWAACGTHYYFDWSTRVIDGQLLTINGQQRVLQVFCGTRGYQIYGPTNPVAISVSGGTPPFALQVIVDGNKYLYQERVNRSITFNLNATNFTKGGHFMQVFWSDSCGWTGSAGDSLCVPDSIPPCAVISNPVDGKCIRRAMTMLDPIGQYEDPITIHIEGNDLTPNGRFCVDQSGVLKVDFQWAKTCCAGGITNCVDSTIKDSLPVTGSGTGRTCDTFPSPYVGGHIDSIICVDSTNQRWKYIFRDTTICRPCTDDWQTFAIDSANGTDTYTAQWFNHDALAWITKSGTNIYLRGVVYDKSGNIFYTPCTQVCIDIDTPPICIRTENLCPDGRLKGFAEILAELDWMKGNTDDIESIYLYTKKHHDPDLWSYWYNWGAGSPATNATMWTWNLNLDGEYWADQTYYDFRVIAKTTWGTWSYDIDGNTQFDPNTFDTTHCDAKTWLIDKTAPKIAIDTAWTTINGNQLIIPNTGCRVSDPKGYLWTQFGNTVTVQPTIYPFRDTADVVKTEWRLYDGAGTDGATCGCNGSTSEFDAGDGAQSYVFAVNEGAHAMDKLVFDPTKAPFVHKTAGYQTHVLHVKAWDGCGNTSEDCITVYLLDIDTTEAILISPVNDSVFCDKMSADGGIRLTAATLLSNEMKKAVFAYRAKGTTTWHVIDSVAIPPIQGKTLIGEGTLSIIWYPKAAGLADGDYELTVWATDGALNHQVGDGYPITIHLSCAVPTVAMTFPQTGNPAFIGCPIEVTATASSPDPGNPIVEVNFYIQSIMNTDAMLIGSDNFTVDGTWSVAWDPHSDYWKGKLNDGQYYMWAEAKNRAGMVVKTALKDVVVRYDETGPHSEIIQVNGDRSDGGATDPTIVEAGQTVPLYVLSADDKSPAGYGATDNSGLDSVMIYVTEDESIGGKVVFGKLMTPVDSMSSLYVADWFTNDWPRGLYHVTAVAIDKACNESSCKCDWLVKIVNGAPSATIGVTEAKTYCDVANVKDGPIHLTLTPATNEAVSEVEFWRSKASSSDVYDMWSFVGFSDEMVNGVFTFEVSADSLAAWGDGLYRLRAFYKSTDGTWIDDGNHNNKFDDFTFDPAHKSWQMLLNVDRSATEFTVALSPTMTIKAGNQVKVTVTPAESCDVAEICYGAVAENGNANFATNGCVDSTRFSFNPTDSGLVSLNNGFFHGSIRIRITDPLGNTRFVDEPLWILDLADTNQVRIVSPLQGAYVAGIGDTLVTGVTARKLTNTALDSVVFYQAANATDAGTRFGKAAKTTGSDEFVTTWNIKDVPEGDRYIWGVAWRGASKFNNAPRTWVIITKTPKNIVLQTPEPHDIRVVGPDTLTFVGGRVDLCLDRAAITSIVSGVGIDSVVFGYRYGDAPGGSIGLDPSEGWTRIAVDRYGSLCVDWFSCDTAACHDGRYALVAWVFDKAGHVNHSNIVHVMVDCTKPYSEVVNIEGDETFGTCHEIVGGAKVPIIAVNADDRSCAGSTPTYNSGAKLLQFFAGQCGAEGGGGAADVVFVMDITGSMGGEIEAVKNNVKQFADNLVTGGVDAKFGLVSFKDVTSDGADAVHSFGMASSVTELKDWVGTLAAGGGGDTPESDYHGIEAALSLPFRTGSSKYFVLITDAPIKGDSTHTAAIEGAHMAAAGVKLFDISIPDDPDHQLMVSMTGGQLFDLGGGEADFVPILAAISSSIVESTGGVGNPLSVVFTQTITNPEPEATAYWNTTGLPVGQYCVWTKAVDGVGNVYTSRAVKVCVIDKTAPIAWIAGFGTSNNMDADSNHTYKVYARTTDIDVESMMFQERTPGSDWVTIGLASKVNGDSSLWQTSWVPCGLANLEMRAVPTDFAKNSAPDDMPILSVNVSMASNGVTCIVTPTDDSHVNISTEDRAWDRLGMVNVTNVPTDYKHTSMITVWADLHGALDVEKIGLRQYEDVPSHQIASFDGNLIKNGGTGWFWAVYNDLKASPKKTYLKMAEAKVYWVNDVGFPGTASNTDLGCTVTLEPGALTSTNGVSIFPARDKTVWLNQQHLQAWPVKPGNQVLTAIRLTTPIEDGTFNTGRYAKVTISYDPNYVPNIASSDLTVAWWNDMTGEWDMTTGIRAGSEIKDGKATFWTNNLYGVYAVVSAGGVYYPGAVDVKITDPAAGGSTNAWPAFHAIVKSKLNMEYENHDIDPDHIIVTMGSMSDPGHAVTILTGETPADDWSSEWDDVSGALLVNADQPYCGDFNQPTGGTSSSKPVVWPGLTAGEHWVKVQAFNKQGYWSFDSTTFTVDAVKPQVTAEDARTVCPNATFHFNVTESGSGVNWDSVFVDVHDFTASVADQYPLSRLIETVGPDDMKKTSGGTGVTTVTFTVNASLAEMRRVKLVIYDGIRHTHTECGCVEYDHVCDGIPDMVGNHTEITEVTYTVDASACMDTTGGTGATVTGSGGSSNPFDPYSGGFVTINFNGFVAGGGKVSANVYDLTGEHVKTLTTGSSSTTWDGSTDESDKKVAEGVYLVHLQKSGGVSVGSSSQVLKIVVKRK